MRRVFFFISLILLIFVGYFVIMNSDNIVNIQYLKGYYYTMDAENLYLSKSLSLGAYTIITTVIGAISGIGIISLFLGIQKDKVKAYKRELEKTAISGEANASKVSVLEAKIKTLEKAFNTVADERTKLEIQIKELNTEIENLNKNI